MPMRTIAGDCLVRFDGARERRLRGRVLVVIKPDDTVLVHDADGYQPAAWLTRPEYLSVTRDPLWLVAVDGEETLRLEAAGEVTVTERDVTVAGVPVGGCRCGGSLVRADGDVRCLDCGDRFALPSRATVLDEDCECGLPRMRAERGATFELCIDRDCQSLDEAVADRFDREWDCPDCGGNLRILRRGGLLAGCEQYPECETSFAIPEGIVDDDCECGLPVFATAAGRRCLDATCDVGRS